MAFISRVKTTNEELFQLQDNLVPAVEKLYTHPLVDARILQSVSLAAGATLVPHLLGRTISGWAVVSPKGTATVYEDPAVAFDRTQFIRLVASAALTTSLLVW